MFTLSDFLNNSTRHIYPAYANSTRITQHAAAIFDNFFPNDIGRDNIESLTNSCLTQQRKTQKTELLVKGLLIMPMFNHSLTRLKTYLWIKYFLKITRLTSTTKKEIL